MTTQLESWILWERASDWFVPSRKKHQMQWRTEESQDGTARLGSTSLKTSGKTTLASIQFLLACSYRLIESHTLDLSEAAASAHTSSTSSVRRVEQQPAAAAKATYPTLLSRRYSPDLLSSLSGEWLG